MPADIYRLNDEQFTLQEALQMPKVFHVQPLRVEHSRAVCIPIQIGGSSALIHDPGHSDKSYGHAGQTNTGLEKRTQFVSAGINDYERKHAVFAASPFQFLEMDYAVITFPRPRRFKAISHTQPKECQSLLTGSTFFSQVKCKKT